MAIKVNKEQGISIGYSTALAWVTIVPAVWFLAKPFIVDAVADDMGARIKQETQPLSDAFRILLQREINDLQRQITTLEFRRDQDPEEWTLEDAQDLGRLQLTLASHEEAMEALERSGMVR